MAATHTGIEWTDATWNPVVGCTKVSPGCDRCYAERLTHRFPQTFPNGFALSLRPDTVDLRRRWRSPRRVFVNSMSDLLHADVPVEFIARVFAVMAECPQHVFQVLTKRAERVTRVARLLPWPDNVWMGVSVESRAYAWRVAYLQQVPAAVRFISAEPLLEDVADAFSLDGIGWLIAGGESQPGARPAALSWFRDLRDHCTACRVPFFLKQLGGTRRNVAGMRHYSMGECGPRCRRCMLCSWLSARPVPNCRDDTQKVTSGQCLRLEHSQQAACIAATPHLRRRALAAACARRLPAARGSQRPRLSHVRPRAREARRGVHPHGAGRHISRNAWRSRPIRGFGQSRLLSEGLNQPHANSARRAERRVDPV